MSDAAFVIAALAAGVVLAALATAGFLLVTRRVAAARRTAFLPTLGAVVRIATPCRVVSGRAPVPGTIGLTPERLVWDAPFGLSGSVPLQEIKQLETDQRYSSGRPLLRMRTLRVTCADGRALEFLLTRGHEWEWRQALGEFAGRQQSAG